MLGSGFTFGLGQTLGRVAARAIKLGGYVKNNLKIYFDFKSSRAKTLEFVGTGSASFTASSNHYINIGDAPTLTTAGTVMAWVKPTSTSLGANEFAVISKYDTGANKREWMLMTTNFTGTNGVPSFLAMDTPGTYDVNTRATSATALTANKWHHLAGTFSTEDKVKIYVDGILMASSANSLDNAIDDTDIDTRIGIASTSGTLQWEWDGNIAQVCIWERVLSASEIQNIMHKTYSDLKGTELTHLVSWWGLDSSSDTYADSHGDNDGTNSGSTLQDGIYGGYSPRKPRGFDNAPTAQADLIGSGSGYFVVGDTDYIDAGTDSNLILGNNNFTMCGWVKANSLSSHGYMLAIGNNSNGKQAGIGFTNANKVFLSAYSSPIVYSTASSTLITTGKWIHFAAVYTGGSTDEVDFYLDGIFYETESVSTNIEVGKIRIGMNVGTGGHWDGNIAQVGIFDAVLTQEQIQSISQKTYSELSTSEKTNLVSWWGLDVNANDEHGSNNGTLS